MGLALLKLKREVLEFKVNQTEKYMERMVRLKFDVMAKIDKAILVRQQLIKRAENLEKEIEAISD